MTGPKINERPGTRAVTTNTGLSATKVRHVLDLIRNKPIEEARDILKLCDRVAAEHVLKTLNSAVANATNNEGANGEELQVVACFADEARTLRRSRPRAKGRATPINKRSSHITIVVARMDDEKIERLRKKHEENRELRRRRVQASRSTTTAAPVEDVVADEVIEDVIDETVVDETTDVSEVEADVEASVDADETASEDAQENETDENEEDKN